MDSLITLERGLAFVGALVVGATTSVQLKQDWHTRGLDNQLTKALLGLMAFGCVLVVLAAVGAFGKG